MVIWASTAIRWHSLCLQAGKLTRRGLRNRLSCVCLIIAEGGTWVDLQATGLVIRRQCQVDAGEGQPQRLCEAQTALSYGIRDLEGRELRVLPVAVRIGIINGLGVDGGGKEGGADGVYPNVDALDERLELRRAPLNMVQPGEILRAGSANWRASPAAAALGDAATDRRDPGAWAD